MSTNPSTTDQIARMRATLAKYTRTNAAPSETLPATALMTSSEIANANAKRKPKITATPNEIRRVVDEAECALVALGKVYVRGRDLVHVIHDRSSDWLDRPTGMPSIVPLADETLREYLGDAATWIALDKDGEPRLSAVPTWVVATLRERGEWTYLPHVEAVSDTPVLRADGTIHDVPGYDERTRVIYEPGTATYPVILSAPTHDDARTALDTLLTPFVDFPFVGESDRAATAAMILSLVGRAAIDGVVPMYGSTAPTPGSGKGLLVDACAIIATGRAAPKMGATSSDDETRKRLLALAIESPALVLIDNIEGALGSPALAMALTAGVVTDRVLGATKMVTASLRPVWAYTGNNVDLRGDLGRRVIPIGLDPGVEHPEDRTGFAVGDLLAHVRERRPWLVVAALTVLRAYVVAGRPAHGKPIKGSFEAWDALVRGALIWCGAADPRGGESRIRESGDSDLDTLRTLLATWHETYRDKSVTIASAIAAVAVRDALALLVPRGEVDPRAVGYVLRRAKGRIVDGMRFEAAGKDRRATALWRVVCCR